MVSETKHMVKIFLSFLFSLLLQWETIESESRQHHMVNRGHHYRWSAANLNIRWALIAIEQWGFLACHTYYDTGHPFIMVISEDLWHSHLLPRFSSGAVTTCFYDLGLSRLEFEYPTFRLLGQRSALAHCTTAAGIRFKK